MPKLDNPISLNEYKHIFLLVGCIYKIISKILSNRVNKVVLKVINVSQYAFIFGRGLLDNVLIIKEVVENIKRKRKNGVVFKIDYEKTYDSLS